MSNIPSVSFEFFPPNNDAGEERLWEVTARLAPLAPSFVSVTYGAGGSTRVRTDRVVRRIQSETGIDVAAHLTCVGASMADVDEIATGWWEAGIRKIVALRGDMPPGAGAYSPHPQGYRNAEDLVGGLKRIADFEISVAAYPESHPDSASPEADMDNLKRKIGAGATRACTQFFFDPDVFLRFLEKARAAGIPIPIVPGIIPVTNFTQTAKFSKMCGANVPEWMFGLFDGLDEDPETRKLVAASVCAEQCRVLHANGINEFHFYTMNKADLCYAICHVMGVRKPIAA